jgi:hypothetical protein
MTVPVSYASMEIVANTYPYQKLKVYSCYVCTVQYVPSLMICYEKVQRATNI